MRADKVFVICAALVVGIASLTALRLSDSSVFAPEVFPEIHGSLLSMPQAAREDDISLYGKGVYQPIIPLSRFQDAFVDAFRTGKARHSILGYCSADSMLVAEFNILAGYEERFTEKNYGFLYKGFRLEAEVAKRWELNTYWWNGMFTGDQEWAAGSELLDSKPFQRDNIRLDNLTGDISYNAPNLNVALGRGRFPIGNSISGSIILNDRVNDYGYLLAEGRMGDFSLSLLHGTLMADSNYAVFNNILIDSKHYPDKYLALHSLGYHPSDKVSLFMGETVVYGNRSLDINYLLPNSFWRATEHNLRDRDNVLIFAGGQYRPVSQVLLYAQVAFDELSYGKLFTNWWGNKYALQGGLRYYAPSFLPDSKQPSITMECTAVRPYTYTHYMNHTMYSHDGRSLGYPKGSNVLDFSAAIKLPYKDMLLWQSGVSISKQGSVGNEYSINYNDIFPGALSNTGTATWFEGSITHRTSIENSLLVDVFAHHRLLIYHNSTHNDKWTNQLGLGWQLVY